MLFNLWLVILLTTQVAEATVTLFPNCAAFTEAINDAITQAIAIAEFAHTRIIALRDGTLPLSEWSVALNTFNTYFGALGNPGIIGGQGEFVAPNAIQVGDVLIGMLFYYNT